jgi:adenylyl- and sulfurtransferase ThiI
MRRRATIARWTGAGSIADLKSSVEHILGVEGLRGDVERLGDSLIVSGPEPARTCSIFGHLPGVSWLAAGYAVHGTAERSAAVGELARRYLRRGGTFSVEAEVTTGTPASDLEGALTSHILDLKRARVSSSSPQVMFRAALDDEGGAVGIELSHGPGGVPTGRDGATCLISGGRHSSVMAWQAVLMGYRVRLVHASDGDDGLLAAASLYSELSFRSDPRWLSLVVVEGGEVVKALRGAPPKRRDPVFCGLTAPARGGAWLAEAGAESPLYLLSEEWFDSEFKKLGVREWRSALDRSASGPTKAVVGSFGGRRADVSEVLDGLS